MNSRSFSVLLLISLSACSSGQEITSHNWTCESLKQPVIDMSQDQDSTIIEIGDFMELSNIPGNSIKCSASAEWSKGSGNVEYGAHISDGGKFIIEYRQM